MYKNLQKAKRKNSKCNVKFNPTMQVNLIQDSIFRIQCGPHRRQYFDKKPQVDPAVVPRDTIAPEIAAAALQGDPRAEASSPNDVGLALLPR